ncbi:MAG: hypothetical protein K6U00_05660 [Armatimonadetes bacterium]|nr:hypothetical protein [Armatimonadota bacterium]
MKKAWGFFTAGLLLAVMSTAFGKTEYVKVIKIFDNNKAIVQRSNGEQWVIEKGVGAPSFWRYENKQVIISSPYSFGGTSSQLILPDDRQQARIWDAERIEQRSIWSYRTPSPPVIIYPPPRLWSTTRVTDLMTPEEKRLAGLSKLTYWELEALNTALRRVMGTLVGEEQGIPSQRVSLQTPSSFSYSHDFSASPFAFNTVNDDFAFLDTLFEKPMCTCGNDFGTLDSFALLDSSLAKALLIER